MSSLDRFNDCTYIGRDGSLDDEPGAPFGVYLDNNRGRLSLCCDWGDGWAQYRVLAEYDNKADADALVNAIVSHPRAVLLALGVEIEGWLSLDEAAPGPNFSEVTIYPEPSGFGDYECSDSDERWRREPDLIDAIRSGADAFGAEIVELGIDPLPAWADDIRGRVRNEPDRLFAVLYPPHRRQPAHVAYVGVRRTR